MHTNPANGHMALLAGIGLGVMGISVPGSQIGRYLGPAAFLSGLALVVWALFRPGWLAEMIVAVVVALVIAFERRTKADRQSAVDPRQSVAFDPLADFVEMLSNQQKALEIASQVPPAMTDLPGQEWFDEVHRSCEATWQASKKTAGLLSAWCGRQVASLYESDRGLDARYDGPTYPRSKNDLDNFVVRRQLRLDQIIGDIRRGAITLKPPNETRENHREPLPPPSSSSPRIGTAGAANDLRRKRSEVVLAQIGDVNKRSNECSALIKRGHWFKSEVTNPGHRALASVAHEALHGDFRSAFSRWCLDVRGFLDAYVVTDPQDLLPESRERELLAEWTVDSVLEIINAHLDVLRTVKRSIRTRRVG